jgi:hypothetical protein
MRFVAALSALVAATAAFAATPQEKVLLVPLDSRPAASQFAYMIGRMASVDVKLPPYDTLGRFTNAGSPGSILHWLETQDYAGVDAVIVSADMIAYGGLIASRVDDTTESQAMYRLNRLALLRRKHPEVKFYVYSAIMRLAPTATRATAAWRLNLAKYEEMRDMYWRTGSKTAYQSVTGLATKIPPQEIARYEAVRTRDINVQRELLKMTARKDFDYLLFGQDDAKPYGPHIPETARLKKLMLSLQVGMHVYFAEGIDQQANILLSRALLAKNDWTPTIRVVWSDEECKEKVAQYETRPLLQSLKDQIVTSGSKLMGDDGQYDYTLYLNGPKRREDTFQTFVQSLTSEVDQGFPIAVADVNIGSDGTSDPELFAALYDQGRMPKLLSFAGWNTAGNTMGTTIPAANVYLLARKLNQNPLQREVAQREFLLHRFVNDYAYHKFTRPKAYALIDASPKASREETYGEAFQEIDQFVRSDLAQYLQEFWTQDFEGKKFFAGQKQYQLTALTDQRVFLPWPRAYEVRLEFKMRAEPVENSGPPPR